MAHVSTNPTWTDTTSTPLEATPLENIENAIDAVSPSVQGLWTPSMNSLLAWAFDPILPLGSVGIGGGTMPMVAIPVSGTATCTGIVMTINSLATGLTVNQNWAWLYNSAGTLVGSTAQQATNWASTGTKVMPFSGGTITVTKGTYYVWALVNNTSGGIGFAAMSGSIATVNLNRAAPFPRSGFIGTSNTTLPSTAPTPTSLLNPMWAAIY